MNWNQIIGQEKVKELLIQSLKNDRVSHAQIFYAQEGIGGLPLALAYVKELFLQNGGDENTAKKVDSLQHPDLHFIFPNSGTDKVKSENAESKFFLSQWRSFVKENPYGNLMDWLTFLQIEKKQGIINKRDAETIVSQMSMKSYEGGYKATIIWLPEHMNDSAANKLLKIIEEPPEKTLFLLVTENVNAILPTILSRCQLVKINSLKQEEIANHLIKNAQITENQAKTIASLSEGNLNKALKILHNSEQNQEFEAYFARWVRGAFIAKKNIGALHDLVDWTNEIATWGREKQKSFIVYCMAIFREALLHNYQLNQHDFTFLTTNFNWNVFSQYIHGANIEYILEELNVAHYHIERNVNAKMVFLDISIKNTRYLHKQMQ